MSLESKLLVTALDALEAALKRPARPGDDRPDRDPPYGSKCRDCLAYRPSESTPNGYCTCAYSPLVGHTINCHDGCDWFSPAAGRQAGAEARQRTQEEVCRVAPVRAVLDKVRSEARRTCNQFRELDAKEAAKGWIEKLEEGRFGIEELDAHKQAAEMLGENRVYGAVVTLLEAALRDAAGVPDLGGGVTQSPAAGDNPAGAAPRFEATDAAN